MAGYSHAKEQLIAQGMDRQQVEKMAVGQVIRHLHRAELTVATQTFLKTMWYLPVRRIDQATARTRFATNQGKSIRRGCGPGITDPDHVAVVAGSSNCRQSKPAPNANLLFRVIEALRMYAAEHDDHLPNSLDRHPDGSRPEEPGHRASLPLPT